MRFDADSAHEAVAREYRRLRNTAVVLFASWIAVGVIGLVKNPLGRGMAPALLPIAVLATAVMLAGLVPCALVSVALRLALPTRPRVANVSSAVAVTFTQVFMWGAMSSALEGDGRFMGAFAALGYGFGALVEWRQNGLAKTAPRTDAGE